ncbi:hypothetical protein KC340_g16859 [Hortaea werneckii]|nr:hypothetical protein KC342_g17184 [Hortaea werneckii]KAI7089130.1 hypothetical protein KC339_g12698 [Hortaea werneckii]KAI7208550.1 hypothetical protein KC365_g16029 [Hortaea werneckii]KAI7292063.1 hypothetical protein KC340_g16859 [Hortaea werneckii]
MDTRPRAMPRAPSSRSPNVVASPAGGATAVATTTASSSSSAGRPSSTTLGTGNQPSRSQESYHSFAQREEAARILQSYEKLSWYSYARCESLAQTRLHFRNLVAGFTPHDEAAHRDYTEDLSPLPSGKSHYGEGGGRSREEENNGGGGKGSRKGKERASLPGAGGESPARGGVGGSAPSSSAGKKKKRRSEG